MSGAGPTSPAPQPRVPPRSAAAPADREPPIGQRRAFADALLRHAGKGLAKDRREEAADAAALLAPPREFAAAAPGVAPQAAGDVDPALHAQLDRIAAAIAELARNGAEAEVHLSLPLGAYRIEGAVLGRDPAGQLNVLLLPGSAVPPVVAAQWTEQLQDRLVRRRLRVGKVAVQPAARQVAAPA